MDTSSFSFSHSITNVSNHLQTSITNVSMHSQLCLQSPAFSHTQTHALQTKMQLRVENRFLYDPSKLSGQSVEKWKQLDYVFRKCMRSELVCKYTCLGLNELSLKLNEPLTPFQKQKKRKEKNREKENGDLRGVLGHRSLVLRHIGDIFCVQPLALKMEVHVLGTLAHSLPLVLCNS